MIGWMTEWMHNEWRKILGPEKFTSLVAKEKTNSLLSSQKVISAGLNRQCTMDKKKCNRKVGQN